MKLIKELPLKYIRITNGFWHQRQELNREQALTYQWQQYEECGTIDNFRITGKLLSGQRRGFFYTDSDLHKWADAASRVLASGSDARLEELLDEYIGIMRSAQQADGYLFTYNQIYFPEVRWKNLQLEHELYCMGHFIEAGVEHSLATGRRDLLDLVIKCADLIVADFKSAGPEQTPGHQQIEIALIKLYRLTGETKYLQTAKHFLEQRGRIKKFWLQFLKEGVSHFRRAHLISRQAKGDQGVGFEFGENVQDREPPFILLRSMVQYLTGSYQQQHRPIREQLDPVGHSVRWAYMVTAAAMLADESGDSSLKNWMVETWQRLVGEKMYVTGGIGSLPYVEGFGRPYELHGEFAYCETCAAIGSIFWNWEMLKSSDDARYAALMEWQLYNAASVGISADGKAYFYRNPLKSGGALARQAWFETACCPSNISRLWAEIGRYIYTVGDDELWINQYISNQTSIDDKLEIRIESQLPWSGGVSVNLRNYTGRELKLNLRLPVWGGKCSIDDTLVMNFESPSQFGPDFFTHHTYHRVVVKNGDEANINIYFEMPVYTIKSDPSVEDSRGKLAVARGPLVYCMEEVDNPILGKLVPDTLIYHGHKERGGIIEAQSISGHKLTLVPYFAWGNRGNGAMRVWLDS